MDRLLFLSLLAALTGYTAGCASGGGPVDGPIDAHCGTTVVAVDPSACTLPASGVVDEESPVHFGDMADDDDCKYHVSFDVTALYKNQDATFHVTLTRKTDGSAVTGADPNLEVFLSDTHPAPNSGTESTESPPGTYTVKPVVFDASGRWTVRFHFFETCTDTEDSPHGHAAFYVDVP